MDKKVAFIGEMPSAGEVDALSTLCGVSPAKFSALFDYATLFNKEVPWFARDAALCAQAFLRSTTYPILVLCGPRVSEAFGVAALPMLAAFPLEIQADHTAGVHSMDGFAPQVRLTIKIMPSQADKFYRKKGKRVEAKALMQSLVIMNQAPATAEEARACCNTVRRALGANKDLVTELHLRDVERALDEGQEVDSFELRKLMIEFARNVKLWVKTDD